MFHSEMSMPTQLLSYRKARYFSKLICDYLEESSELTSFYHRFPKEENFLSQLKEKQQTFGSEARLVLQRSLTRQYEGVHISEATQKNLELLSEVNTFTITTGHQLNLFTGPLYFLYKIISVLNLCETLKEKFPEYHFVPTYWMATEDHDFEEINYFNFKGKKIVWDHAKGGAVGELDTAGLDQVSKLLAKEWGQTDHANYLLDLFQKAYLQHQDLAKATQFLVNELFGDQGLLIVDGNDAALKQLMIPYFTRELQEQNSFEAITKTTASLTNLGYQEQVHPREINLFYLTEGTRERIVRREQEYFILDTDISFNEDTILKELNDHPERFSPNALLRPLYQEVILPNICYVGGGGELAYWFQLKDYFDSVKVVFPVLLLRNSALLISEKQQQKLEKLGVSVSELFLKSHELSTLHTKRISEINIDFTAQRNHLKKQFEGLYELAKQTDESFLGAVAAQEKKQLNGLDKLEKRLLKAQKRKLADQLERLHGIQNELFPEGNLQERMKNFSEFYLQYGPKIIRQLKADLDPLEGSFNVVTIS